MGQSATAPDGEDAGDRRGPGPAEPVREVRGRPVRVRREPRLGAFATAGAVVGLVVAVLLTFSRPEGEYSYGAVLGYLSVVLLPLCAVLGALVAVYAGRRRR